MFKDLLIKNRSIRFYDQSVAVSRENILDLVDCARISNSAGNRQPLKYFICHTPEMSATVHKYIGLAGNPPEGKRPAAYLVILLDSLLKGYGVPEMDCGIAAEVMLLRATEIGLGGCMIGMVNRKGLQKALSIPDRYEILLVLAIGKPQETHVFEVAESEKSDMTGWWDEQGVRHVPKRRLEDIVINY